MGQAVGKTKIGINLTEGPLMKSLLLFAFPIVLTNLVQQLYSMVDLIVIGQFVGSVGTVGVNTGGEVADLLSPVAMGFSTAGQIYIAQLMGAGEDGKIKKTVGTLLSFMLAAALVLGGDPFLPSGSGAFKLPGGSTWTGDSLYDHHCPGNPVCVRL